MTKAIRLAPQTMAEAEGVAAQLGLSAEALINKAVAALIHDLKQQLDYLESRANRARKSPKGSARVLALVEEGIPEDLQDVEINRRALAKLIKEQGATLAHNQKALHELLGLQVNN